MQKAKKIILLCITLWVSLLSFNHLVSAASRTTKESGTIVADNQNLNKATKITQTHTNYNLWWYGMNITKGSEIITSDKTEKYLWEHHYNTKKTNEAKNIYCLDAIKIGLPELYATRFLMADTNHDKVNAYDAAIMSILTSTNGGYTWQSIAIRCISVLWDYNKTEAGYNLSKDVENLVAAYEGQVYKWIKEDAEIQSLYIALYEKIKISGMPNINIANGLIYDFNGNAIANNGYYFGHNSGTKLTVYETIVPPRNLFAGALRDALEYLGSKEKASVKEGVTSSSVEKVLHQESEDLVSGVITHNFVLKDFTNDGKASFMISNLLYKYGYKGVQHGAPSVESITIKNGSNTTTITSGPFLNTNLLDKSKFNFPAIDYSKEITISVAVKIAGYKAVGDEVPTKETLSCSNGTLEYEFNYTWQDSSLTAFNKFNDYVGIVWYGTLSGGGEKTSNQRFISVETNANASSNPSNSASNTNKANGSFAFDLGCESCNTLISKCNGNDNEACSLLAERNDCGCEAYQTLCNKGNTSMCTKLEQDESCAAATCGTEVVGNFQCCDLDDNILLIETKNKEISINGPQNVVSCFVNQVDRARSGGSNSSIIEDEKGNSYVMLNNRYCTVSCKEDYILSMPSSKKVNASGYFTFDMAIKGTKSCYTNTIDKDDKFISDLRAAEASLKEAYQVYMEIKEIRDIIKNAPTLATPTTTERTPINYSKDYSYNCTKTEYETYKDCSARNSCYSDCGNKPNQTECGDACEENYPCETKTRPKETNSTCAGTCSNSISGDINRYEAQNGGYIYYYGVRKITGPSNYSNSSSSSCTWTKTYYKHSPLTYTDAYNRGNYNVTTDYNLIDSSSYDAIVADALKVLKQASARLNDVISEYQACSDFTNKYNYQVEVSYSYDDNGTKRDGEMELVNSTILDQNDSQEWYCKSSLLNGYGPGKCSGSNNESTTMPTRNISVFICSNANTANCSIKSISVSSAKYASKISSVNASYKPLNERYNYFPSGVMGNKNDYPGLSSVPAGNRLSVSLNSGKEIRQYDISIKNLGEFYSTGEVGRLIGHENAALQDNDLLNYIDDHATYHCSYLVNMGNVKEGDLECMFGTCGEPCSFMCIGAGCDSYCTSGNCAFDCLGSGCIYSSDDGLYIYEKEVSLNNLFPEGTDSYNWDRSSNQKAKDTVKEIEDKAESVYGEDPILRVTIDGSSAAKIKEYNKANPSYSNETMYFKDLGSYKKIAGFSNFIDDLIDGKYGVVIDNNSDVITKRNNNNPSQNNYFSIWSKYSKQQMLGPSWK